MSTFEKRVETVDVTTNAMRRDETWQRRCSCGEAVNWDNVRWCVDSVHYCEDCMEDHEDGHWCCPRCQSRVDPRMKGPSGIKETRPGIIHYLIDGREVGEEEWQHRLQAQQAS